MDIKFAGKITPCCIKGGLRSKGRQHASSQIATALACFTIMRSYPRPVLVLHFCPAPIKTLRCLTISSYCGMAAAAQWLGHWTDMWTTPSSKPAGHHPSPSRLRLLDHIILPWNVPVVRALDRHVDYPSSPCLTVSMELFRRLLPHECL